MSAEQREIFATYTPAGKARVSLDGREFDVERRDAAGRDGNAPALCPVELIGVSLAA